MTNADGEEFAYSAKAPPHKPKTASPDLNWVTFLPTASTWPATSRPGPLLFRLLRADSMRRRNRCLDKPESHGLTEAARTLIKTSSSPGAGLSISSNLRTSGELRFE